MDISESQAFSNMITDALAYWKQDASKFTINVWWQGCKPFTLEQVSKALTAHATDPDKGQFPPKVADIVRHLAGTKTDRSLLAWGKVYDAMSSVGAYQDVDFGSFRYCCGVSCAMTMLLVRTLPVIAHRFGVKAFNFLLLMEKLSVMYFRKFSICSRCIIYSCKAAETF